MEATNSVVLENSNRKLETEHLIWDESKNLVYTDKKVIITTDKVYKIKGYKSYMEEDELGTLGLGQILDGFQSASDRGVGDLGHVATGKLSPVEEGAIH